MLRRLRVSLNSEVELIFRLQVCNAIPTVIAIIPGHPEGVDNAL